MRFPYAEKGVKKLFVAELLLLIVALTSDADFVWAKLFDGLMDSSAAEAPALTVFSVCGIVAVASLFIGGILCIVGYLQAARDEKSFLNAAKASVIAVVLDFAANVLLLLSDDVGWASTVLAALAEITWLFAAIFLITGVIKLSQQCARADMEKMGGRILSLLELIYVLHIIILLLNQMLRSSVDVTITETLLMILEPVNLLLSVARYVIAMIYLVKAARMLRESGEHA